jgi:hypothetical protein
MYGNDIQTGGVAAVTTEVVGPDESAARFVVPITDLQNGQFEGSYKVSGAGRYSVHMKLDGVYIRSPESMSAVFSAGPFVIAKCGISAGLISGKILAVVGVSSAFSLKSADQFDNLRKGGGDFFQVQLYNNRSAASVHLRDLRTGIYDASFVTKTAGNYSLFVSLFGNELLNMPVPVTVFPGPASATKSAAFGAALSNAVAGATVSFSVQSKYEYGNALWGEGTNTVTADFLGSVSFTSNAVYNSTSGLFVLTYTPTVATTYTVSVRVNGIKMSTSYTLIVSPAAVNAAKSSPVAASTPLPMGRVGDMFTFTIQTRDQFSNNILQHRD